MLNHALDIKPRRQTQVKSPLQRVSVLWRESMKVTPVSLSLRDNPSRLPNVC